MSSKQQNNNTVNPLLSPFETPFGAIPFEKINTSEIKEAIVKGMQFENEEIEHIVKNTDTPTFDNTLYALERTGDILNKGLTVMGHLLGSATTNELEALAQEMSPAISEHYNNINFNKALFNRIKNVKDAQPKLDAEEQTLLDKTYEAFERRGVGLSEEKQRRLREVSMDMGQCSLKFSRNLLEDTNRFILIITDKKQLKGLPSHQLEIAAQTAKEKGKKGWAFTLQSPSFRPILTYCDNRDLRKKVWLAYNRLSCHGGKFDNLNLVSKLVNLRRESAQILNCECFADLALKQRMAGSKEQVSDFLEDLIKRYKPQAKKESKEIKDLAKEIEGKDFKMKPWDYGYYSHKLELQKFDVDSEKLRPYFELSKVIKGVFGLATTLYGIQFKENKEIPVYHTDVKVYEVYDKDGSFLALFYADFYPRANKKSGAWTGTLKEQYIKNDGTNVRPHVAITMNFTKPTNKKPALLTLGEVSTFLHEFGHALHEIFSNTRFESLSGTNVFWDFVELPSQLMENFATEKDFLKTFAVHYKTGETMPNELIDKIIKSKTFNAASACLRQVSLGLLDMAYYTLKKPFKEDIIAYEKKAWKKAEIESSTLKVCMTTQFQHIMTGGYAAGYYCYKWAEVLDADAFSLFKKRGIFNKQVAESFRRDVLEKGGTKDPNELYFNFRQHKPTLDALLIRDGIINNEQNVNKR